MDQIAHASSQIPRDTLPDSTIALLSAGNTFISSRSNHHHSDIFETRLFLRDVYCTTGWRAAEAFYHPDRFTRRGGMPQTTLRLLQDKGSVAVLDGEAHRNRKQMFMSMMTPERISDLVHLTSDEWRLQLAKRQHADHVVLHDVAREVLTRAICRWAGIPQLTASEAHRRTREFSAMIDGAGSVGPRNWRGLLLREFNERWCRDIITSIRSGELDVPAESAAHVIAWHRDVDGALLEPKIASVELINILRPTVAVGRFIVFAALALHEHPDYRAQLQSGADDDFERFVQEVRRFYPFFPFVGGRALTDFSWRDHDFPQGTWFLLDLYGTNHDGEVWEHPDTFDPEHFRDWDRSPYNFIPQGGGDFDIGHRCPGEWITIQLLKATLRLLVSGMAYTVPDQDLRVDLTTMPALPKSGFVISDVRSVA